MIITSELLFQEYIISKKPSEQIGRELGCTGRNIRYLLKKFGFNKEMEQRKRTVGLGRAPANKGVKKTSRPKLGRYYVTYKGKVIPQARMLMMEHLGRPLDSKEVIHHKDHNPLNDTIENLEITTPASHIKHHKPLKFRKYTKSK